MLLGRGLAGRGSRCVGSLDALLRLHVRDATTFSFSFASLCSQRHDPCVGSRHRGRRRRVCAWSKSISVCEINLPSSTRDRVHSRHSRSNPTVFTLYSLANPARGPTGSLSNSLKQSPPLPRHRRPAKPRARLHLHPPPRCLELLHRCPRRRQQRPHIVLLPISISRNRRAKRPGRRAEIVSSDRLWEARARLA